MNDKNRVWSDGQGDKFSTSEDMMANLADGQDENVTDQATRSGIILLSNCKNCGTQWKARVPWAEVAMMFCGQVPARPGEPPPWRPTRQGVVVPMGCRCGKVSPLVTEWDEIRKWVDTGIRSGALDPAILRAVNR